MAIYTKQGEEVEVVAYHGKHSPISWKSVAELVLVSVRRKEEPRETFGYFAFALKADGGPQEIDAAIDAAPEVTLDKVALRKAIKEAE